MSGLKPGAPDYLLSPHVHACLAGTHVILLDLRLDRYLAFESTTSQLLQHWIGDWPIAEGANRATLESVDDAEVEAAASSALERMLRDRLITERSIATECAPHQPIAVPSLSLLQMAIQRPPAITAKHAVRFARAVGTSLAEHRLLPLHEIVRRFRARQFLARREDRVVDVPTLQQLVLSFLRLRPLAFGSKDSCFFHSMAIARYLAYFRVSTRWVFGVQDAPFGAHCWLVHGDVLLNDTLEHVAQYTPIMEV